MKRNQFLLAGTRFLASTFIVAFLGVLFGMSIKNQTVLLVDIDEAIVSSPIIEKCVEVSVAIDQRSVMPLATVDTYTYMVPSKSIIIPLENTMNAIYYGVRRLRPCSTSNGSDSPTVNNTKGCRQPRSDTIPLNTS
jgi:hypothetical protein